MEDRSLVRIMGLGMILMLMLMPVSPVLAAGFESSPPTSATTAANVERPDMTVVSSALCDRFGIECDKATMAKGVYIDPVVWEFSPQWTLIMLGSTKRQENILNLTDGLDAPKEKKNTWKSTLEALWEQYPVRTVETEDGLMVTVIPEKSDVRLAPSEEAALRELDEEIGRAMISSLSGGNGVQWSGIAHAGIIKAACAHNSVDAALGEIAGGTASAPDFWPYSDLFQRCYNHGYVPPPIPPIPGIPMGFGGAPENCQKNATDAATAYYNNRLDDAFTSLGHSSHFMTDIGNPMHTGEPFVQGILTAMGWNIHGAYETYVDCNWETFEFNETVYDTVETEVWSTPDYSTRLLGWKNHQYCDPLILLVTENYLAHNGEFHLEEDPAIRDITVSSLIETTKHTNGLVHYVIKSANPGEWIWSRDGWDGWSHEASWSGTQTGPCSEYGPVMVGDHGEHGADMNLRAGSTTARVERQFTDASGTGWNTLTFVGLLTASDVPGGRWMTIEVNGQQIFAGTASQTPPGNGRMFEISVPFPQSDEVNVAISHGQSPAWRPRFAMHYYSLNLTLNSSLRDADIIDGYTTFVMPDPDSLVTNATVDSP